MFADKSASSLQATGNQRNQKEGFVCHGVTNWFLGLCYQGPREITLQFQRQWVQLKRRHQKQLIRSKLEQYRMKVVKT